MILGLRVTGNKIFHSLYDSKNKIIISNKFILNQELDLANNLKNIRSYFLDYFSKNEITSVSIKLAEKNSFSVSIDRISIEGVLQEIFATEKIKYLIFNLSTISKNLGINSKEFKLILDNNENFNSFIIKYVDMKIKTNNENREAILLALGSI